MKKLSTFIREHFRSEEGAALPTVLFIAVLLVTASAALLSAAGASARNSTDVLSETKAYYAAESGIQSAINVLRNYRDGSGNRINYKDAVNLTSGDLSTWLTYSGGKVPVGIDPAIGYSLQVSDPDNAQLEISFTTDVVSSNNTGGFSRNGVDFSPVLRFDNDPTSDTDYTTIEWVPNDPPVTTQTFGADTFVTSRLGAIRVTNVGNGAPLVPVSFRVNLRLGAPDDPTWVIKGTINSVDGTIAFTSSAYRMIGSDIWLCNWNEVSSSPACPASDPAAPTETLQLPAGPASSADTIYGVRLTPMEPQRLALRAIGFGPNGAKKTLEAVIHKTFFPAVPPAAGILMNGPNASFDNGNGMPVYHGCDPDNPSVCVPSIGVTDPGSLDNVENADFDESPHYPGQPNPDPPPAIVGEDLPEWQQSPSAMDAMIQLWRFYAEQAGTVYTQNNANVTSFGDFATGTGLTFCDANCSIQGDGGGILIVRGRLTTTGGVNFKGMIVVTGEQGVLRNGNGGPDDQIIGSLIISPYTLDPDAWLQPVFNVNGGGSSSVTYSGLDYLFDGGITGASNFVSGVAEK
jgi:hypothetical protein